MTAATPGRPAGRPAGGADAGAVDAAVAVLGPLAEREGALGARTTYRVGGPAAVLVVARGADDLAAVAAARAASGLPTLVVGRGSNLLVADSGFPGIAVVLDPEGFGALTEVYRPDPADRAATGLVRAGGALPLPALARRSVDLGHHGLEWAVGVPGSVGGGVRMNAGGHGSDMAASVRAADVVDLHGDGTPQRWGPPELRHAYRSSAVGPTHVVVSADLAVSAGRPEEGRQTIREIVRWRREHQPGGQNAGSVFTNPTSSPDGGPPRSAGALVEAAGLKGHRIGTAEVSPKHANFIQADPGGSADDVHALMRHVQAVVSARSGVTLHTEIRLIGFADSGLPAEESPSSGGPGC